VVQLQLRFESTWLCMRPPWQQAREAGPAAAEAACAGGGRSVTIPFACCCTPPCPECCGCAVPRDADAALVKRQYYRLARQWHPDKNAGNAEATTKFQLLGEAYQVGRGGLGGRGRGPGGALKQGDPGEDGAAGSGAMAAACR
jgi:hypothetical protein